MYKNKLYALNDTIDKLVEVVNDLCDNELNIYFNLNSLDDMGVTLIDLQFEVNAPKLNMIEIKRLFKKIKGFDPDYINTDYSNWTELPIYPTWQHLLLKLGELLEIE